MKKTLKLLLLLLIATPLIFQSCVEENDDEAKLEIFVQADGTSIYGAMVKLYLNEEDFKAQNENHTNEKKTDLLGYAMFTGLSARQYYISVTYDGVNENYDNLNSGYDLVTPQPGARLNETIDIQLATKLIVTVKDLANMGVSDVIVKLYESESDMLNATDSIITKHTTSSGKAEFSHLFTQEYFYSVTIDDVTTNYTTEGPLIASTNYILNITYDPNNSALVVKVFDNETSSTIEGAVVTLYDTEEAWRNRKPEASIENNNLITDENGEALFYNLGEKQYYISARFEDENSSLDNNTGLHYMESPTVIGESTQVNIGIKASTKLEITVQDTSENPISGAEIKLYNNQTDIENEENIIDSVQTTSSSGIALFDHLFPQVYYFSVSADGETMNYDTEIPLTESTINQITLRIGQNTEKGNTNAKAIADVKSKKRLTKVANGR
ncbi:MAG: carboxypeptidase-like regulatory domain-containing protein [Salinivirgaceae bacterium]|jgi:hypothetical protein|nr:carboxypeptidase-like regulatory domain-containing protein [Salinivirgaceae bacterium]